ncbi:Ribosomal protein L37ae [mine drainage metagenome]|uniref:Ribosomal protein L37ae n=1 Tax=mine drainage metagenome TaxID=410659 RepID=T0ZIR3_9ZZZZ
MVNASIRYGARIRKQYAAVQKEKNAQYKCPSCGKIKIKRVGTGIWKCRHCGKTYAGGAYTFMTPAGEASVRLISNLAAQKQGA